MIFAIEVKSALRIFWLKLKQKTLSQSIMRLGDEGSTRQTM